MPRVIVLDSFPLSSLGKIPPRNRTAATSLDRCAEWVFACVKAGNPIQVPAIVHYEVSRELHRLGATAQLARIDRFCDAFPYRFISLSDPDLRVAAQLWAAARNQGTPTAHADAMDIDVVLAAQVIRLNFASSQYIVATTNPKHLTQYVNAADWTTITPGA